ncbi:MAG: hypothetical protein PHU12_01240 [Candidatus Aenigmarchaeota archaeon]|nr:hypothetical protein [Candidatus Aenigmarchaeota archaeon]
MKKLLILLLLILVIVPGVYAGKNVTLVSQTPNCFNQGCECYSAANNNYDYLFCKELEKSYGVKKINENEVVTQNAFWLDSYQKSNLIFIGNVSDSIITTPTSTFCTNIKNVLVSNQRQMFSTGKANQPAKGCIFDGYVTAPSPNLCTATIFTKLNDGFPTSDLSVGEANVITAPLYSNEITIRTKSQGSGWIGASCKEFSYGIYPVVDTGLQDKAIFWGLDVPANYTSTTWSIFDKTLWYVMGDYSYGDIDATLKTDKTTYKPGEKINITLEQGTANIDSATLVSLTYPDGTSIDNVPMDPIAWNLTYAIEKSAPNGTYTIKVKATAPPAIKEFTKKIDVIPYTISATLNKASYVAGENVDIGIVLGSVYDSSLNATAKIEVTNPAGTKTTIYNEKITYTFNKTYATSSSSIGGVYLVRITLTDTDSRIFVKDLSFTVKNVGNIIVSPAQWSKQVSSDGNVTQLFTIKNNGTDDLAAITITPSSGITLSKTSIASLNATKTENFTATFYVDSVGNKTGSITLDSETYNYVIDVNLEYVFNPVEDSLVISPESASIVTIPNVAVEKEFELENIAVYGASNFVYTISDSIKNIASITTKPTQINSEGTAAMKVKIDAPEIKTYYGTITVNSSVGSYEINLNIEVIGDISTEADDLLKTIVSLNENITALQKKGKDVSGLQDLSDSAKEKLESTKEAYESGNYQTAKTYFDQAGSSIDDLKSQIEEIRSQKPNYSGIIWTVAFIIIIAIVGIVAYKYKDKIKELINKLTKKEPEQKEEYTFSKGDYRTEYY